MLTLNEELDGPLIGEIKHKMEANWNKVKKLRRHFYTITIWSKLPEGRRKVSNYIEDAVWGLREVPWPRPLISYDYTINKDWVMSPVPRLPWKYIAYQPPKGFGNQGLISYPGFEGSMVGCNFCWKNNPFSFKGGNTLVEFPGVEYLHSYWMARYHGLIDASDVDYKYSLIRKVKVPLSQIESGGDSFKSVDLNQVVENSSNFAKDGYRDYSIIRVKLTLKTEKAIDNDGRIFLKDEDGQNISEINSLSTIRKFDTKPNTDRGYLEVYLENSSWPRYGDISLVMQGEIEVSSIWVFYEVDKALP